ncbi:hypothetical protein [Rufibacter immobilis]|uniref:hypothetical protein n=1 Tax=Rufibacter immobilis TaxID=1348778 RepID=UPI0035E5C3BD
MPQEIKEQHPYKPDYSDEVDLREVLHWIRNGIHGFRAWCKYALGVLVRYLPLILLLIALLMGTSYYLFTRERPYYTSSATLLPGNIRNEYFKAEINRLADLVRDGNHAVLNAELKLGVEQSAQIKSLTFLNLEEEKIEEDSVLEGAPFQVKAEVYDNTLFIPLQKALQSYLGQNVYFAKRTQARKEQLEQQITKLKQDIATIDSLVRASGTTRGPVNGFVYGEPLDPSGLYRQSTLMLEDMSKLEAELKELETVQVVVGFAPMIHPTAPILKKYLLVGGTIGGLVAFLVALWIDKRRKKASL